MNKVNTITFCKACYQGNREEMYKDIARQLEMLMRNEYLCKVKAETIDIVTIEFEHDESVDPWGCPYLVWLNQEELERLEDDRITNEDCGMCGGD